MSRRETPLWNYRSRSRSPSRGAGTAPSSRATPRYSASDATDREQLPSRHSDSFAPPIRDEDEDDIGEDDEGDEGDDSHQIVMAVDQRGSQMGCAYYTAAESKLCFIVDVELPPADCFDVCELLLPGCGRE